MGQVNSSIIPNSGNVFTPQEINKLHKRFSKLDHDKNGYLELDEIYDIPALSQNPMVHRVLKIFDTDKDGKISFVEFIHGLATLSAGTNEDDKLRFAFKIYDNDEDGFISSDDLFVVLKSMVGTNLSDVQLHQLVDRTIIKADEDQDGKISYLEFTKMVKNLEIAKKLTLTYE